MRLMGASPERPCDDELRVDASSRQARGDATDFLRRPVDQNFLCHEDRRAIVSMRRIFFGGGAAVLA